MTDVTIARLRSIDPADSVEVEEWAASAECARIVDRIAASDPTSRAREWPRRRLLVAAVAAVVLLVGASAQAGGIVGFHLGVFPFGAHYSPGIGKPAAPTIRERFIREFNTVRDETSVSGMTLDPNGIRKFAVFRTSRGAFAYYVAPLNAAVGAAQCTLVTGPGSFGDGCMWMPISRHLNVGVDVDRSSGAAILSGVMPVGIVAVTIRYANGGASHAAVNRGWFYAVVQPSGLADPPVMLVGRDRHGVVVDRLDVRGCFRSGACNASTY